MLNDKPEIWEEKVTWLQRHDKDCGGLYGMLLLAKWMPAALTDHIDRNLEKNLLRGRIGYIDTCVVSDNDQCIFGRGLNSSAHGYNGFSAIKRVGGK